MRTTLLIASILALFIGCTATVDGGKLSKSSSDMDKGTTYTMRVTPEGIEVNGNVKYVATTQASNSQQPIVTGPADALKNLKLGQGSYDTLGSISVVFQQHSQSLIPGLIFLGGAVLFYFLGKPFWCAACVAGAILSWLYPAVLVWAAIGVFAYVAYLLIFANKTNNQLISGVSSGLEKLPAELQNLFKLHLQAAQDQSVQSAVNVNPSK